MKTFINDLKVVWELLRDWCVNNTRKALAVGGVILAAAILLPILCCAPRTIAEGSDPANQISWQCLSNGTLIFEGEGGISGLDTVFTSEGDVLSTTAPEWYNYRSEVTAIEIGRDVMYVGMDSFVSFPALETVTVRGESTELDIDCIRYEDEAGWERFSSLIIFGPVESSARSYAEFNGLEFRPL